MLLENAKLLLLRLLTAQRGPDASIQRKYEYDYDRYGNRWAQTRTAGDPANAYERSYSFDSATNRLASGQGFGYDASGNINLMPGPVSLTFDSENRLTQAGSNITYTIESTGRRVRKSVDGTSSDYFYIGTEVIAEKTGSSWTDYVFFGGMRIAKQTGNSASTATYFHNDHLGSVRRCTDSSGASAGTCDYEPFGEFQPGSPCGTLPSDFRFAGMRYDSETQLYHTLFRQYDPAQGRWLGVDPVTENADDPQTLNRYVYVRNSPGELVDPLGLCWCVYLDTLVSYNGGLSWHLLSSVALACQGCDAGKHPLSERDQKRFDKNREQLLKKLEKISAECAALLDKLGKTLEEIRSVLRSQRPWDGMRSSITRRASGTMGGPRPADPQAQKAYDAEMNSPVSRRFKDRPGSRTWALAQLNGLDAYYRPGGWFSTRSVSPENIWHESLHNLGLTDPEIMQKLNLPASGGTDVISQTLKSKCLNR